MRNQIYYSGTRKKHNGLSAIINVLKYCIDEYSSKRVPVVCEFKGVYVSVNLSEIDEARVKVDNFTHVIMVQLNNKNVMTRANVYRVGSNSSPVTIDFTRFKERRRQSHIYVKSGPFAQTFLVNKDFDIEPDIVEHGEPVIVYKVSQRKRQLRFIRTVVMLPLEKTDIMYMINLMCEIKIIGKH